MINKPSLITQEGLRFLIMDSPSRENAESYANQLLSIGVVDLVRTCKVNYEESIFELKGIRIHVIHKQNLYFQDGSVPPRKKVTEWLELVKETFINSASSDDNPKCIAVHCLAGLGRAPVLVGIALIELGMKANEAIALIRKNRSGALNQQQIKVLMKYKRTGMLFTKNCCVIY